MYIVLYFFATWMADMAGVAISHMPVPLCNLDG